MRATMPWLGLLALVLSSSAGAAEFACEVPWHSSWVNCSEKVFSVRHGETLTITVTQLLDSDGKGAVGIPVFEIVNANTRKTEKTFSIKKGASDSWKNDTGVECIVVISARIPWAGTRIIRGNYTVGPK